MPHIWAMWKWQKSISSNHNKMKRRLHNMKQFQRTTREVCRIQECGEIISSIVFTTSTEGILLRKKENFPLKSAVRSSRSILWSFAFDFICWISAPLWSLYILGLQNNSLSYSNPLCHNIFQHVSFSHSAVFFLFLTEIHITGDLIVNGEVWRTNVGKEMWY